MALEGIGRVVSMLGIGDVAGGTASVAATAVGVTVTGESGKLVPAGAGGAGVTQAASHIDTPTRQPATERSTLCPLEQSVNDN